MQILRDKDTRFKNLERKVGIFVLGAIITLCAIIITIGIQQDIFTSKSKVYFFTTTGTGIYNGMAVKLSGFKIGKVDRITLDNNAMVKVGMSIITDYMKWIKIDSKAYLKKEDLIGDSIIEISRGSDNAVQVSGDALIPFEREKGLTGIAEDLNNQIKPVIAHVASILEYVNDPNGELKLTVVNLRKISAQLSDTMTNIKSIVKTTDKSVPVTFDKVNGLLESTQKAIESTKKTIETTEETIKKTDKIIANIESITGDAKSITGDAKQSVPKILPTVPRLMKKGERITDGAQEIVDSLKQTWPISNNIKPQKEDIIKIDSYE
ncbi:MAG: MCE family protein [Nitrospirae bacterium]|nr:MCE family protein [Nitrospirota bacterium]MBF0540918.1 MCE family protein [Nitrospirota bacterium]